MKIKEGLEKEYEEYIRINSDSYSKAVIDAGESVGNVLDEGKTPEEAGEVLNGQGLTGYMAGATISAIVKFHSRGEEVRIWWNSKYGVSKEEKGTVNPAILTLKEK